MHMRSGCGACNSGPAACLALALHADLHDCRSCYQKFSLKDSHVSRQIQVPQAAWQVQLWIRRVQAQRLSSQREVGKARQRHECCPHSEGLRESGVIVIA